MGREYQIIFAHMTMSFLTGLLQKIHCLERTFFGELKTGLDNN